MHRPRNEQERFEQQRLRAAITAALTARDVRGTELAELTEAAMESARFGTGRGCERDVVVAIDQATEVSLQTESGCERWLERTRAHRDQVQASAKAMAKLDDDKMSRRVVLELAGGSGER